MLLRLLLFSNVIRGVIMHQVRVLCYQIFFVCGGGIRFIFFLDFVLGDGKWLQMLFCSALSCLETLLDEITTDWLVKFLCNETCLLRSKTRVASSKRVAGQSTQTRAV